MEIKIDTNCHQPMIEQVAGQIRALIADGSLARGEVLPAVRVLADELNISRLTTGRAYEALCREGILRRTDDGFTVA